MDAKARIAEMLRQKRETQNSTNQPAQSTVTPTAAPITPPTPIKVTDPVVNNTAEQHSSSIDRINAMLRQRQQSTANDLSPVIENSTIAVPTTNSATEKIERCQICLGRLIAQTGIFQCDKCQRRFIKQISNNEYFNIAELPFGICECCEQRAALIKLPGTIFPQCSTSKETYIPTNGRAVRLKSLPFGLCRCCEKPEILVATHDQSIRCPASKNEYVRNIDGSIAPKPPALEMPNANEIEAALNDGNAAFYYGGFIGNQTQTQTQTEPPRRTRRRRWPFS